jgi:hypothetical protein
LVGGQDCALHLHGSRTDQNVCGSALDTAAAAEVEQAGGFLVMERCERFILEGLERSPQFVELSLIFDAGQNFLPDGAKDGYPPVLYGFGKRSDHKLLVTAHRDRFPSPQQERPDAGINQDFHGSISMRSSWRIFL